ncbi:MAG: hypothetical protein ACLP5H_23185 [Desulfomonilaceae bacterium]
MSSRPTSGFSPFTALLCYITVMFQIAKQARGDRGSFVKLIQLDADDFAVIVRAPSDVRLHHRYIGPDSSKAEEIFSAEVGKLNPGNRQQ